MGGFLYPQSSLYTRYIGVIWGYSVRRLDITFSYDPHIMSSPDINACVRFLKSLRSAGLPNTTYTMVWDQENDGGKNKQSFKQSAWDEKNLKGTTSSYLTDVTVYLYSIFRVWIRRIVEEGAGQLKATYQGNRISMELSHTGLLSVLGT